MLSSTVLSAQVSLQDSCLVVMNQLASSQSCVRAFGGLADTVAGLMACMKNCTSVCSRLRHVAVRVPTLSRLQESMPAGCEASKKLFESKISPLVGQVSVLHLEHSPIIVIAALVHRLWPPSSSSTSWTC